jgi:TPP-dependent pyruvate/acetoin dehydrogenase alpha subunit
MVTIRRFEERTFDLYRDGIMKGLAHLYIGEEAVAVGACAALRSDDYITSTHRGHGHCIAKGGKVDRMMAEILGKVTGYCRGKGGSMHIADMEIGILGANGIVAGGMGIATGAALSAKIQGTDRVALCFFGDGAVNQGILLETANLAVIWKLPVIYLCENNLYGQYTDAKRVTGVERAIDRAAGLGLSGVIADGNDVVDVYEKTRGAVQRARAGEGPTFIECVTYRYGGHHVGDQGGYRTREEVDQWKEKDPIRVFGERLIVEKIASQEELSAIEREVDVEVNRAVDAAKQAPFPDVSEVEEDVYA